MSTQVAIGLLVTLLTAIAAAVWKIGGIGHTLGRLTETLDSTKKSLESHRDSSARASADIREDVTAIRDDLGEVRERVARIEGSVEAERRRAHTPPPFKGSAR